MTTPTEGRETVSNLTGYPAEEIGIEITVDERNHNVVRYFRREELAVGKMSSKGVTEIRRVSVKKLLVALAIGAGLLCFPHHAKAAAYDYNYAGAAAYPTVKRDTPTPMWIRLQNAGTSSWAVGGIVRLGTSHPMDRVDGFSDSSWLGGTSGNRIALTKNYSVPGKQTVDPGETAEFDFTMTPRADWATAPLSGTYRGYFQPVADGVTWMKDIGIYWDVTSPAPIGTLMFQWYGPGEHRWVPGGGGATTVDNPHFGTVNGHYSSDDPNVRRQQLQAMVDAGMKYVALDWWFEEPGGQGAYIRGNAIATANMIKAEFPQLKYLFFIEPRPWATTIPQYAYDDFWAMYGNDPQWQHYQGKPLLMTFGSMRPGSDTRYSHASFDDNRGGTSWWIWEPPREVNRTLVIFPSFDNRYCCPPGFAYDPTWTGNVFNDQTGFAMATRSATDIVLWYGWNEYYERSQIEPNDHYLSIRTGTPTYIFDLVKNFNLNTWYQ